MPYLITHPKSLISFIEVPKWDFQKHVIKIRSHKSVIAYLSKENLYHMIHGVFKLFSSLIHNIFKVREGNRNELLLFYEPFETEWFQSGFSLVFFCFSNFRKTLTRWHYRIEKKQFCQNPWPSVFFTTAFLCEIVKTFSFYFLQLTKRRRLKRTA